MASEVAKRLRDRRLNVWNEAKKIAEDAAKKAVGEYKLGEVDMSRRKLYTDIGKFVAVLALLAWIIIQYLSTVKK